MSRNCLVMFGTVILTRTELVSLFLPDLPRTNGILFLHIWVHWKWIWAKRMLSPQWYLSAAKPLCKWSVRGKCLTPHSLPAVLREVSAVDLRIFGISVLKDTYYDDFGEMFTNGKFVVQIESDLFCPCCSTDILLLMILGVRGKWVIWCFCLSLSWFSVLKMIPSSPLHLLPSLCILHPLLWVPVVFSLSCLKDLLCPDLIYFFFFLETILVSLLKEIMYSLKFILTYNYKKSWLQTTA